MSNHLLIDASVLIKTWAVAFFGFHFSGILHILPVIAVTALVIRFFYNKTLIRF